MSKVILKEINKVYENKFKAVKDFNLEIEDGEFVVLVGPSGCGKSTTLRMVAGLEEITSGTIQIGDRVVNTVAPKDRDIAMVFQNYALYPHMSVYDNMAFGLKLRNYAKSEIDKRVREAAAILGMEDLLEQRPKQLSGGQRQRVAVGRAIVRKPQVFLFDEPLSNLDAKMRVQMRIEISRLHSQLGATMIYVTHDQIEAMTMGDRIVVMEDGLIHQVADPIALYDRPANKFIAGFIGTPPMNFFEGYLKTRGGILEFDCGGFQVTVPVDMHAAVAARRDKSVILGIRPEHVGSPVAEQDGSAPRIPAKVELSEPMGSETYVYLKIGTHSFIARMDPHRPHRMGETLSVAMMPSKLHFFDSETSVCLI